VQPLARCLASLRAGQLREASFVLVRIWMLEQVAAHRQHDDLKGWLEGKREPWIARLPDGVREQVEGFVDEAVEDAQAKLRGHAIPRSLATMRSPRWPP
jgi:hypothetical protein